MIRFSAALVAVAIGVLLGGIATSKLLLVYIAIVVSAVALVALAIGVVLKREELFGEGQGLVPATAGASPALPARAGESQGRAGESQGKAPAGAHVASPPPFAGAAAGYAAFGGNAPSAPAGVERSGRPTSSGPGRSAGPVSGGPASASQVPANPAPAGTVPANTGPANPVPAGAVPPWEATPAARGPWSSSTADWMPSGQDERAAGAGTQGGRAGGWRVAEADAQAAAKAPRSWAAPSSSAAPEAPPVTSAAEPASAAPSWFDRLGSPAGTDVPTVPPGSGGGWPWSSREGSEPGGPAAPEDTTGTDDAAATEASPVSSGTVSGDAASSGTADAGTADAGAANEDDWPARYSWLDDDTDEAGEVTGTAGDTAHRAGATPPVADDTPQAAGASATVGTPAADAPAAETAAAPVLDAETLDDDRADSPAAEDGADIIAFPGPGVAAEPGTTSDVVPDEPAREADRDGDAVGEADGEPSEAAREEDAEAGPGLVTVVPGVPRYHRTDCVLIRFMPAGDVHQVPVSEARDAGCTPCAACQPEG